MKYNLKTLKLVFKISFISKFKKRRFYKKLINKNDICFDIGANIGSKSKLFLSIGAKVIAFEPQSSCLNELSKIKNRTFNFYPFAVGAKNEEKELHLSNISEVATLSNEFIDYFCCDTVFWDKKEIVTVKSLDYLIEKYGLPKYCKIDVEGYELEILSSLTYEIPIIEFEFTGGFVEDTIKIIQKLSKTSTHFNYVLNENLKFKLKNWVSADEMITIIKSFSRDRLHGNIFVKNLI
ncbi:FkbM family methyltransferase [Flavobacterium sp. CF136]|uniref:FkbM family methyltransferase n=1 Tax=Flavobacterium sp. (strain CF136) TaxID=1144313 RepID=UPI0002719FA4|nr:FkbM family methyltransferase [Flavobacterium sp. CF136]EJL62659.1 methyltransferase, FkbM family [Flavobacterium sp. CF136]